MFDLIKKLKADRKRKMELLESIAKSLKALEGTIDNSNRYGGAIKTTPATRY